MPTQPKVLIVEDDEATSFARTRILERGGFSVTQVRTVADALASMRSQEFDIVLADIGLPDGNGYELCRQLHEDRPNMPVVLISAAYVDDGARAAATYAGACEFLTDPVPGPALVSTLKRHL